MQNTKISKKELREMVNGSMREALERLRLPKASKQVRKLLDKSARKIASEYAGLLKREKKKQKKSGNALAYAGNGLPGRKKAKKQAAGESSNGMKVETAHV